MNVEMDATVVFEKIYDAIQAGYRYINIVGGARSSKTYSLLQNISLYGYGKKEQRISVFRATKESCRATIGMDFLPIYHSMGLFNYNKSNHRAHFSNKSFIEFTGFNDPNLLHGYNTDVSVLNEPYDISETVFKEVDKRTSKFIILDKNPKQDHWSDKLSLRKNCITIECTFKDNPFIPEQQKVTLLGYQPVHLSAVVLEKQLTTAEALNYDCLKNSKKLNQELIDELIRCQYNEQVQSASEYDWVVYGLGKKADKPNRIFKWRKVSKREFDSIEVEIIVGIDWGTVDPMAIIACKYKDGTLYVHEYNYASENELSMILKYRSEESDSDGGLAAYVLNKHFTNDRQRARVKIICDSNRPQKVMALRKLGYESAMSVGKKDLIIDSIGVMQQIKTCFTDESPNIEIEQELYSRQTDRLGIVLEQPEDKNNHTIDAIKYVITYLRRQGLVKVV